MVSAVGPDCARRCGNTSGNIMMISVATPTQPLIFQVLGAASRLGTPFSVIPIGLPAHDNSFFKEGRLPGDVVDAKLASARVDAHGLAQLVLRLAPGRGLDLVKAQQLHV